MALGVGIRVGECEVVDIVFSIESERKCEDGVVLVIQRPVVIDVSIGHPRPATGRLGSETSQRSLRNVSASRLDRLQDDNQVKNKKDVY